MNLSPEIQWGVSMVELLDCIEANENDDERQRLGEAVGWLRIVREISVRYLFPRSGPKGALQKRYRTLISRSLLKDYRQELAAWAELMLLSEVTCEVIESLFGKGKRLEGQQSRSGFTAQWLSIVDGSVRM